MLENLLPGESLALLRRSGHELATSIAWNELVHPLITALIAREHAVIFDQENTDPKDIEQARQRYFALTGLLKNMRDLIVQAFESPHAIDLTTPRDEYQATPPAILAALSSKQVVHASLSSVALAKEEACPTTTVNNSQQQSTAQPSTPPPTFPPDPDFNPFNPGTLKD